MKLKQGLGLTGLALLLALTYFAAGVFANPAAPTITSFSDSADPVQVGSNITFNVDWADADGGEAVTQTALTSDMDETDASSYNTASISPSANKLILMSVYNKLDSPTIPTVSGNGLTWVQINTRTMEQARLTLFRAMGSSPSSGAVTISFGSTSQDIAGWAISEFGNIDTGGTNGSAAIVQNTVNTGLGFSQSVTLSAFSSVNNATYGTFATKGNNSYTPGGGFTEIHDVRALPGGGGSDGTIMTEWRTDNDTSVDATFASGGGDPSWAGIAVEIKAALENVKAHFCKTNAITTSASGGSCSGGSWASSSALTTTDPIDLTYTALSGDAGTNNYYTFVCDDGSECSSTIGNSGTFVVNNPPTLSSFSDSPDPVGIGQNVTFTADWADAEAGSTSIEASGIGADNFSSLAVDSSGVNKVAYYDSVNDDLRYAECSVQCINSANWTKVTVYSTGSVGRAASLALNSSNNPRISYYDNTNGRLLYAECNGTCTTAGNWTNAIVDTSSVDIGFRTSIVMNSSDNPRILYYDVANTDVKYAECNASCTTTTNWTWVAIETVTGNGFSNLDIELDSSGNPRVTYWNNTGNDLIFAQCNTTCTTAGNWTKVSVDTTGDVGTFGSLELNSSNNPRISYFDSTNQDLKYAECNTTCTTAGNWTLASIDTAGDVGNNTSLALDTSGNPRISYRDLTNEDLKFAKCSSTCTNAANWTKILVDDSGSVGWYTSLALDASNNPRITHFDITNGTQKYSEFSNLVKAHFCKTNAITPSTSGGACTGASWASSASLTAGDPINLTYTAQSGDAGTNSYFAFICDDASGCSPASSNSGTFQVGNAPSITSYSDTPDPVGTGSTITFSTDWSDADAGENVKAHACKTNAITPSTSGGTCDGGSWADSSALTTTDPIELTYVTQPADAGAQNYYVFVCDDGNLCSSAVGNSGTFTVGTGHNPTITSFSDSPDPVAIGLDVTFTADWNDTEASWRTTAVSTVGKNTNPGTSVAVYQGNPRITFYHKTNSDLIYSECNSDCTDQANWTTVTVDGNSNANGGHDGNVGEYSSLAINASGNPRIAYRNNSNSSLKYAECNSSCTDAANWFKSTPTGNNAQYISLVLDSTGNPRIAYNNTGNSSVKYAQCDTACTTNSNWLDKEIDNSVSVANGSITLKLNSSDNPRVTYRDNGGKDIRYAECNGDGADADTIPCNVKVDSANAEWFAVSFDINDDVGIYSSLALDSSGNPRVAYYGATTGPKIDQLRYAECNSSCTTAGNWTIASRDVGIPQFVSLALNGSNQPRVSYYEPSGSELDLVFTFCDSACTTGTNWNSTNIDTSGDVGDFSSIVVSGNYIGISYSDATSQTLKYAEVSSTVKAHFCKTNAITPSSSGGSCPGGSWAGSSALTLVDPISFTYTTQSADLGTQNYYTFICDDSSLCSAPGSGTFTVTPNPPSVIGFSDSPDPVTQGSNVTFSVSWYDAANTTTWSPAIIDGNITGGFLSQRLMMMANDSQGRPRVAYQGSSTSVKYAECNADCSNAANWTTVTILDDANNLGSSISLVLTGGDEPRISWRDATAGDLEYAECNSGCTTAGNWTTGVLRTTNDTGWYSRLGTKSFGDMVVTFYELTQGDLMYGECTASPCTNSANWTMVDIDTSSTNVGEHISLVMDFDSPHITYYDVTNANLKYAECEFLCTTAGSWTLVAIDSTGTVGDYSSLILEGGVFYASYRDATNTALKYATCQVTCTSAGNWTKVTVDNTTAGSIAQGTSIALDSGKPRIAYAGDAAGDSNLYFAKCDATCTSAGNWSLSTIESANDVGEHPSMTISPNGVVRIIHEDDTNNDMRYAEASSPVKVHVCKTNAITGSASGGSCPGGSYASSSATTVNDPVNLTYTTQQTDGTGFTYYVFTCDTDALCSGTIGNSGTVTITTPLVTSFSDIPDPISVGGTITFSADWSDSTTPPTTTIVDGNSIANGGSNDLVGYYNSIVLNSSNNPRIAYYDDAAGSADLKYAECNGDGADSDSLPCNAGVGAANSEWTAVKVDGNTTTGGGTNGVVSYWPSIKLNSSGLPRISYFDSTNGDLKYTECTASPCTTSTNWTKVIIDSTSTTIGQYSSLAVNSSDLSRISFYDVTNTDLKYAECTVAPCTTSTNWTKITVDGNSTSNGGTNGQVGGETSMALNSSGNPRITYRDQTNQDIKYAECNTACTTVGNWIKAVVDGNSTANGGINGSVSYSSLVLDSSGNPRVAYIATPGANDLKYAECNTTCTSGSNWNKVIVQSGLGSNAGYPAVANDSSGRLAISYFSGAASPQYRYAECSTTCTTGSNWTPTVIETVTDTSQFRYSSIVFTTSGEKRIAYFEPTSGDLKLAIISASEKAHFCKTNAITPSGTGGSCPGGSWASSTSLTANDPIALNYSTTISDAGAQNYYVFVCNSSSICSPSSANSGSFQVGDAPTLDSYSDSPDPAGVGSPITFSATWSDPSPNDIIGTNVAVDTTGQVGLWTSLKLNSSNNPRVSYHDFTNNDLKYAICDSDCANSANWTAATIDSTGNVGTRTSLALNGSGNPRIAYADTSNNTVKYAECDSGCTNSANWTTIAVETIGTITADNRISLAVNGSGNPRLAYFNDTNDDLKYAECDTNCTNAANWASVAVDTISAIGMHASLVLNSTGNPRIAYYDQFNDNIKFAECNTSCTNTGNWSKVAVDSTGVFSPYISLALNSTGNPRIAYYVGELRYAECNTTCTSSGNWTKIKIDNAGTYPSIAINSSGNPRISYHATNNDLGFAECNNTCASAANWTLFALDTVGSVGSYTSLALNSSDNPRISYFDDTNDDLKYADNLGAKTKAHFCKTNAITASSSGGSCPGGSWASSSTLTASSPATAQYTPTIDDVPSITYFAFVCDAEAWCSPATSNSGTVTVAGSPLLTSVTDSPDPILAGDQATFTIDWSDADAGENVKVHICRTNAITDDDAGGSCAVGQTIASSPTLTTTDPIDLTYITQASDPTTLTYFAFVCDDDGTTPDCSSTTGNSFTLTINHTPTVSSFSDTPDPVATNGTITFDVDWADADSGENVKAHICKTNAVTASSSGGSCPGGSWASSTTLTTTDPIQLTYAVQEADFGTLNYFVFICDDGTVATCSAAAGNSGSTSVSNHNPTISTFSDSPDPIGVDKTLNFSIDWADTDVGDTVKAHVCRTNVAVASSAGGACDTGQTIVSSSALTSADPISLDYTTQATDFGTLTYFVFVCDDDASAPACSPTTSNSGTTAVSNYDPTITTFSDTPDPAFIGQQLTFSIDWTDAEAGENVKAHVCRTNVIAASSTGGSCDTSQAIANSASLTTTDPISLNYTTQESDAGTLTYFVFVCDDHASIPACSGTASNSGTVTVANHQPSITTFSDSPDPIGVNKTLTFSIDWADADVGENVKGHVCRTNVAVASSTGGACDTGQTVASSAALTTDDPITLNYTTQASDFGTLTYFVFVCDDDATNPTCSPATSNSGTTAVSNYDPTISSYSDTPDPVIIGENITFSIDWNDVEAGENVKAHVCKTNAITASSTGGTCPGGSWASSASLTTTDPISLNYTTQDADAGTLNYFVFVCDDHASIPACSGTVGNSGSTTVANHRPTVTSFGNNPSGVPVGTDVTFNIDWADADAGENVKAHVCRTNVIVASGTGGACDTGQTIVSSGALTTTDPIDLSYTAQVSDTGTVNYFVFVCDDDGTNASCSITTGNSGTFFVGPNSPPTISSFSDSPDPLAEGEQVTFTVDWADPDGEDITVASLTSGGSVANATSYATASITPSANKLVLVAVKSRVDIGGTPNQPTLSGNGLTWVAVNSRTFGSTTNTNHRVTVFRSMGASPSAGAITISFASQTQTSGSWSVVEFSGINTSGTNGSGAIVQSAVNDADASPGTVTLAGFSSSNNATYGAIGTNDPGDTVTPGGGFTELHEVNLSEAVTLETEWRADNDTSVDWTIAPTTSSWGAVAVEIKAAQVPVKGHICRTNSITPSSSGGACVSGETIASSPSLTTTDPINTLTYTMLATDYPTLTYYTFVCDNDAATPACSGTANNSGTVTVNNLKPTISSFSDTPDPVAIGGTLTFSADWADAVAGENVKAHICKTNTITTSVSGGSCPGGSWASSGSLTTADPINLTYVTQDADFGTQTYYTFVCDDGPNPTCSGTVGNSGTFTVDDNHVPTVTSFTDSPDPAAIGDTVTFSVDWADADIAAITAASLTSGQSATNATSYATASITPSSGKLILLAVSGLANTGTTNTPTASGNGLTWEQVNTVIESNGTGRTTVFRAMGTPSTGAITIDFAGQTQNGAVWSVVEFSGVDTSGTNGSGAIGQSNINTANSVTSLTVTLGAFSSPNNATYGAFMTGAQAEVLSPGSGFTQLHELRITGESPRLISEWRIDNDTTVNASHGGSATNWTGVAIELKSSTQQVKAHFCKTNAITPSSSGGSCPGGTWVSSSTLTITDPINLTYVTQSADLGTQNYFVFVCDDDAVTPSCTPTTSNSGTFTVQDNVAPTITSFSDSPDPVQVGSNITFNADWSDTTTGTQVKAHFCKTNAITASSAGGSCPGGSWASSASLTTTDPINLTYTAQSSDAPTITYYAFVCDNHASVPACSSTAGNSGTVMVNNAPTLSSFSDSPDPVGVGQNITLSADWADLDVGETVKAHFCKTNAITVSGTGGTCPGGSWASSTSLTTGDPINLTYTALSGDVGTQTYYSFVCDDTSACSGTTSNSGTFVVGNAPTISSFSDTPDPVNAGQNVTFSVDWDVLEFPSIAGTVVTSEQTAQVSSHTISLPSGRLSDEWVVAMMASSANNGTQTWPAPWTKLREVSAGNSTHAGVAVAKQSDLGSATTVVVTTPGNTRSSHSAARITGARLDTTPEASTGVTGNSTNADPDSLSPSWGAGNTLWLALAGVRNDNVTAVPTNYTLGAIKNNTGSTNHGDIGWGWRQLTAASENPGAFTSGNNNWGAITVAFRQALPPVKAHFCKTNAITASASGGSCPGGSWADSPNGVALDGIGDYASTPDNAALDITGDIDLRAAAALDDWTPSNSNTFVSKYIVGTQASYFFDVSNTGALSIVWTSNGDSNAALQAISTTAPSVSDGSPLLVRATLDVNNGASGRDIKFYTKPFVANSVLSDLEANSGWTQLGSTVTQAGTTSIFSGTTEVKVGRRANTHDVDGSIYGAVVKNGIDGTTGANPDFTVQSEGTTSFADGTGKTWTLNGNAAISGTTTLDPIDLTYTTVSNDAPLITYYAFVCDTNLFCTGTTANSGTVTVNAPLTTSFSDTPDPVSVGGTITFTADWDDPTASPGAVTMTSLTAGADVDGDSTNTTASISPSANKLILASVQNSVSSGTSNIPTLSGNGLTWVEVATQLVSGGTTRRLTLFRAMGSSPTSEAITISYGGQSQFISRWSIAEFGGVDTSGTNGSGAVVQSNTNTAASVSSLTVTLGAFSAPENATYGTFGHNSSTSMSVGSGFTQINQNNGTTSIMSEWKNSNDTTVDVSDGTFNYIGIAAEIKAAPTAQVKAHFCKTNAITASGTGGSCPGGTWGGSSALTATDPINLNYTTVVTDSGIQNYYVFVCNASSICSSSIGNSGTFQVGDAPVLDSFSDSPDPVSVGGTLTFSANWSDPAPADLGYMSLDGVDDYASTPDAAALDITGDIDLRAAVALTDWTPTSATQLISKENASTQRSYAFNVQASGVLRIVWSANGSTAITKDSTVAPTVTDLSPLLVRVVLDVDNGASGNNVIFYTKPFNSSSVLSDLDSNSGWTQLGTTVTTAGTTSIFSSSTDLRAGIRNDLANDMNGNYYAAVVKNGIDGTAVANPDFSSQNTGTTSFTDSASKAWTLAGNASIQGRGVKAHFCKTNAITASSAGGSCPGGTWASSGSLTSSSPASPTYSPTISDIGTQTYYAFVCDAEAWCSGTTNNSGAFTVGDAPVLDSYSDSPDPVNVGSNITFSATWTDPAPADVAGGMLLDGSGDFVSTPDHADLDITGDIDIRVAAALDDWTPASDSTLAAKWGSAGSKSYIFYVSGATGRLGFAPSSDGSNSLGDLSTASPTVSDGASLLVRVTLDVNDGAGNRIITFYTKSAGSGSMLSQLKDSSGWTQLGSVRTLTGGTTIFNSTTPVTLGAENTGGTPLAGKIFGAVLLNGIAGTEAANPDFAIQSAGQTAFADSTGKNWTFNGDAKVVKEAKAHFCKTNAITASATGGSCPGGSWADSSALTSSTTINLTYTALLGDAPLLTYYAFVCDAESYCSGTSGNTGTVLVNAASTISSVTDSPDPVAVGGTVTFTTDWADVNSGETVKAHICKTNAITPSGTGGTCPGGSFADSATLTTTDPIALTYTALDGDRPGFSYYAFVCDSLSLCSDVASGTVQVNGAPTISLFSDTPDPLHLGDQLSVSVTWADSSGETVKAHFCKTNAITASSAGGTCPGGSWVDSASLTGSTPINLIHITNTSGTNNYFVFICDDHTGAPLCSSTVGNSATFTVLTAPTIQSVTDDPDPVETNNNTAFNLNWADPQSFGRSVKAHFCRTNSITASATGGACASGQTLASSSALTPSDPITDLEYTAQKTDKTRLTYFAFVCDAINGGICSAATSATVDINAVPFIVEFSDEPDPVGLGSNIIFTASGLDADAVLRRGTTTKSQVEGLSSITVDVPVVLQNELMLTAVSVPSDTIDITEPADWTLVRTITGTGVRTSIYRKLSSLTEPADYTWTYSAPVANSRAILTVYRGVDTVTPINVENGQATPNGSSHSTPSITTTTANTMLVGFWAVAGNTTISAPAGFESYGGPIGDSLSVLYADQAFTGSGATGAKTASSFTAGFGTAELLALTSSNNDVQSLKMHVCKTDAITASSTGGSCTGASYGSSSLSNDLTQTVSYTTDTPGTNNYFVFVCDNHPTAPLCSTLGNSGTFDVSNAPTVTSFSDSPDPVIALSDITFEVDWNDNDPGELTKVHVCKTNAITPSGTGGTCAGGEYVSSAALATTDPVTLTYNANPNDAPVLTYFVFVCDDGGLCSGTVGNIGTVDVLANTAPVINSVNDAPDPQFVGQDITFTVGWDDTDIATGISFVNETQSSVASAATSLSVDKPAGTVENDVMITAVSINSTSANIATLADWNLIRTVTGTSNIRTAYFWKAAGASEPANYTWSFDSVTQVRIKNVSFRNVDTASPIEIENGTGTPSGTDHSTPSMTTENYGDMLIAFWGVASNSTWSNPPAGMTTLTNNSGSALTQIGAYGLQTSPGGTGQKTYTASAAGVGATELIALSSSQKIKSHICRTNSITADSSGGACAAGQTIVSSNDLNLLNPMEVTYTPQASDGQTLNYFAFVCDDGIPAKCSASLAGTVTLVNQKEGSIDSNTFSFADPAALNNFYIKANIPTGTKVQLQIATCTAANEAGCDWVDGNAETNIFFGIDGTNATRFEWLSTDANNDGTKFWHNSGTILCSTWVQECLDQTTGFKFMRYRLYISDDNTFVGTPATVFGVVWNYAK